MELNDIQSIHMFEFDGFCLLNLPKSIEQAPSTVEAWVEFVRHHRIDQHVMITTQHQRILFAPLKGCFLAIIATHHVNLGELFKKVHGIKLKFQSIERAKRQSKAK